MKDQLMHHYGFNIKDHKDLSKAETLAQKVSPNVELKMTRRKC